MGSWCKEETFAFYYLFCFVLLFLGACIAVIIGVISKEIGHVSKVVVMSCCGIELN